MKAGFLPGVVVHAAEAHSTWPWYRLLSIERDAIGRGRWTMVGTDGVLVTAHEDDLTLADGVYLLSDAGPDVLEFVEQEYKAGRFASACDRFANVLFFGRFSPGTMTATYAWGSKSASKCVFKFPVP